MTHLIAALFFSGLLIALALVLQFTVAAYWQDIVRALRGGVEPRSAVRAPARVAVRQCAAA